MSDDAQHQLAEIAAAVRERFEQQKRVLSFDEYLALVAEHPARHTRDAGRYVRDCFDWFGTYDVEHPWGKVTRWKLFDLEFEAHTVPGEGQRHVDRLIGHENIQAAVYRALGNFAREGRANRLILMHGPNGSAKSTFVACIMKAMEQYAQDDAGALYRFSWIFPRGREGKAIGFGGTPDGDLAGVASYAKLGDAQTDARLPSELREHPLMLLPLDERRRLVAKHYQKAKIDEGPPDWIWNGQLGQKNRQIFEALLTNYRGDLGRVLAHVQVERYYVSRRYRVGAVTIGPQMAVDAHERQITMDRSLASLPASLASLTMYEQYGELVDAANGIVEYSDLLKRPLDAWKYLLLAIETGEVSLQLTNLAVNALLIASSNELHLNAFKEHHEYNSFRGRILMIRVPYLLDHTQEQGIYDSQIVPQVRRHVAPHATRVAALWAVLTRLRRAHADRYDIPALGRIAADLTPLEKAELYAEGKIPQRLSAEEARELRSRIGAIYREHESVAVYEGLTGASPREIRTLLLDAAQDPDFACLSPLAVLTRIEQLCAKNDYDFLKETPDRGYHDHRGFVRQVRGRWLDRVDDEVRSATGLIEETQYHDLFDRYVTHVSFWVKNERVYNRHTGKYEDPDTDLMITIEKMLDAGERPEEFRRNLISAVAAQAIDHPGEKLSYTRLFPRYLDKVKEAYFGERRKQIATIAKDALAVLAGDVAGLEAERQTQAKETIGRLRDRFGYCDSCARDAIGELVKQRYAT